MCCVWLWHNTFLFAFNYIAIDGDTAVALHMVVCAFMQGMLWICERTVCRWCRVYEWTVHWCWKMGILFWFNRAYWGQVSSTLKLNVLKCSLEERCGYLLNCFLKQTITSVFFFFLFNMFQRLFKLNLHSSSILLHVSEPPLEAADLAFWNGFFICWTLLS